MTVPSARPRSLRQLWRPLDTVIVGSLLVTAVGLVLEPALGLLGIVALVLAAPFVGDERIETHGPRCLARRAHPSTPDAPCSCVEDATRDGRP